MPTTGGRPGEAVLPALLSGPRRPRACPSPQPAVNDASAPRISVARRSAGAPRDTAASLAFAPPAFRSSSAGRALPFPAVRASSAGRTGVPFGRSRVRRSGRLEGPGRSGDGSGAGHGAPLPRPRGAPFAARRSYSARPIVGAVARPVAEGLRRLHRHGRGGRGGARLPVATLRAAAAPRRAVSRAAADRFRGRRAGFVRVGENPAGGQIVAARAILPASPGRRGAAPRRPPPRRRRPPSARPPREREQKISGGRLPEAGRRVRQQTVVGRIVGEPGPRDEPGEVAQEVGRVKRGVETRRVLPGQQGHAARRRGARQQKGRSRAATPPPRRGRRARARRAQSRSVDRSFRIASSCSSTERANAAGPGEPSRRAGERSDGT